MVSTHWVNVHGHKSLVAPFGGAEPRYSTNPYCTAVPRKGREPIVLDFATSQVAMGKVRVANNKKIQMEPGLLIDATGVDTTEPGTMYNPPFGAILPFGLHKGGGLAVICDLLAGALTGGMTHSPKTIKDGTDIVNNMLSIIIDPSAMGGTAAFEEEVETFITWVKSAKPRPGVPEVLAPGEPERARRIDREKNGVPIDSTTWQQLIDVARKVRLNDTEIPHTSRAWGAGTAGDDHGQDEALLLAGLALRAQGQDRGARDQARQEDRDGERGAVAGGAQRRRRQAQPGRQDPGVVGQGHG